MADKDVTLNFLIGQGKADLEQLREFAQKGITADVSINIPDSVKTEMETLKKGLNLNIKMDPQAEARISALTAAITALPKGNINIDIRVNTRTLDRAIGRLQELIPLLQQVQQLSQVHVNVSAPSGGGGNQQNQQPSQRARSSSNTSVDISKLPPEIRNRIDPSPFGGDLHLQVEKAKADIAAEKSFQTKNQSQVKAYLSDQSSLRENIRLRAESDKKREDLHATRTAKLSKEGLSPSAIQSLLDETDQAVNTAIRDHLRSLKDRISQAVKTARSGGSLPPGIQDELSQIAGLEGEAGRIASKGISSLSDAQHRGGINLRRAQHDFDVKLAPDRLINKFFGSQFAEEENEHALQALAQKHGVDASLINKNGASIFDSRRLANPETAQQLLFAGLFGGVGSFALGAAGGALAGPTGAFAGSVIGQALQQQVENFFHLVESGFHHLTGIASEFQSSVLAVAGVLQATTTTNGVLSGPEEVRENIIRARGIQAEAQSKLLPLGFGGESLAAITGATFSGTAQKGVILSKEGSGDVVEKLGATIQALRPDLASNPTRIRKDIEDILSGAASGKNTQLGVALKNLTPQIFGGYNTEAELIKATEKLKDFVEAVKNSGLGAQQSARVFGQLTQLTTKLSDAFLQGLTPAIKNLANYLDRNSSEFGKFAESAGAKAGKYAGGTAEAVIKTGQDIGRLGQLFSESPLGKFLKGAGDSVSAELDALSGGNFSKVQAILGGAGFSTPGSNVKHRPTGPGTVAPDGTVTYSQYSDDANKPLAEAFPEFKFASKKVRELAGFGESIGFEQREEIEKSAESRRSNAIELAKAISEEQEKLNAKGGQGADLFRLEYPSSAVYARAQEEYGKETGELGSRFDTYKVDQLRARQEFNLSRASNARQLAESSATGALAEQAAAGRAGNADDQARAAVNVTQAMTRLQGAINAEEQARRGVIEGIVEQRKLEQQQRDIGEKLEDTIKDEALKRGEVTRGLDEAKMALQDFKNGLDSTFRGRDNQILDAAKRVKDLGGSVSPTLDNIISDPESLRQFQLSAAQSDLNKLTQESGMGLTTGIGGPELVSRSGGGNFQKRLKNQEDSLEDNITGLGNQLERLPRLVRDVTEQMKDFLDLIAPRLKKSDSVPDVSEYTGSPLPPSGSGIPALDDARDLYIRSDRDKRGAAISDAVDLFGGGKTSLAKQLGDKNPAEPFSTTYDDEMSKKLEDSMKALHSKTASKGKGSFTIDGVPVQGSAGPSALDQLNDPSNYGSTPSATVPTDVATKLATGAEVKSDSSAFAKSSISDMVDANFKKIWEGFDKSMGTGKEGEKKPEDKLDSLAEKLLNSIASVKDAIDLNTKNQAAAVRTGNEATYGGGST